MGMRNGVAVELSEGVKHDRPRAPRSNNVGIGARRDMARNNLTSLINEDEFGLRAAAVDSDFICRRGVQSLGEIGGCRIRPLKRVVTHLDSLIWCFGRSRRLPRADPLRSPKTS